MKENIVQNPNKLLVVISNLALEFFEVWKILLEFKCQIEHMRKSSYIYTSYLRLDSLNDKI